METEPSSFFMSRRRIRDGVQVLFDTMRERLDAVDEEKRINTIWETSKA